VPTRYRPAHAVPGRRASPTGAAAA
jgi:hypothetical protein